MGTGSTEGSFGEYRSERPRAIVGRRECGRSGQGIAVHGQVGGRGVEHGRGGIAHAYPLCTAAGIAAPVGGRPGTQQLIFVRAGAVDARFGEIDTGATVAGVGYGKDGRGRHFGAAHFQQAIHRFEQRRGVVLGGQDLRSTYTVAARVGGRPGARHNLRTRTVARHATFGKDDRQYTRTRIFGYHVGGWRRDRTAPYAATRRHVQEHGRGIVQAVQGLRYRLGVAAGISSRPVAQQHKILGTPGIAARNAILRKYHRYIRIAAVTHRIRGGRGHGGAVDGKIGCLIKRDHRRRTIRHGDRLGSRSRVAAGIGGGPGTQQGVTFRTGSGYFGFRQRYLRVRVAIIQEAHSGGRRHGRTVDGQVGGYGG